MSLSDRASGLKDSKTMETQSKTSENSCLEEKGPPSPAEEEEIKLEAFGARHTLALMGFFAFVSVYAMRINLSVAIIAMVNSTVNANDSIAEACPVSDDYDPNSQSQSTGEFNWDEKTQGLVLGSFFYGYALTNFIGGRAAEFLGGRLVVGIGVVLTAIFTIVSPFAARSSLGLFIAIRVLEGCAEGVSFPAMNTLVASWYPPAERSKFASFIFTGVQFGTVVTLPISGWLCGTNFLGGWPSVFYIFGGLGIVWGVFWFLLITDKPRNHPRISDAELKYILKGCPDDGGEKEQISIPWMAILMSPPFWAILVMHFCNNWGFYTLLTELPTYFDKILHFNIQSNGIMSALPYFGGWLFGIFYGWFTALMIKKNKISIVWVRRISMMLAGYGAMICLCVMCFVNCHSTAALLVLILSGTLGGTIYCGYMSSHADIAPRLSGTLMGLTNTVATIPGFTAPMVTGSLTQNNQTLWAWRTVFLISAVVYGVGVTVYCIFISSDVQPWNEPVEKRVAVTEQVYKAEGKLNENLDNDEIQFDEKPRKSAGTNGVE